MFVIGFEGVQKVAKFMKKAPKVAKFMFGGPKSHKVHERGAKSRKVYLLYPKNRKGGPKSRKVHEKGAKSRKVHFLDHKSRKVHFLEPKSRKKVGGEAPHLLEGFPGRPGPPRPIKSRIFPLNLAVPVGRVPQVPPPPKIHTPPLEFVSAADCWCKLMSGERPVVLTEYRGRSPG